MPKLLVEPERLRDKGDLQEGGGIERMQHSGQSLTSHGPPWKRARRVGARSVVKSDRLVVRLQTPVLRAVALAGPEANVRGLTWVVVSGKSHKSLTIPVE